MTRPQRSHVVPAPALWLLRGALATGFLVVLVFEWSRWPASSVLLGPLTFLRYGLADAGALLLTGGCGALVLAFAVWPHWATALASALGVALWCCWGVVAWGVGC